MSQPTSRYLTTGVAIYQSRAAFAIAIAGGGWGLSLKCMHSCTHGADVESNVSDVGRILLNRPPAPSQP
ncbi:MAG TPA: hypothetical protein VM537_20660, partial [Anaerolineae bacterium]|nr:hypothetical protein [Anaerolineae bacterium]